VSTRLEFSKAKHVKEVLCSNAEGNSKSAIETNLEETMQ
jgi:hypothetical protein